MSKQNSNYSLNKEYLEERQAVKQTMAKMQKELEKPAIYTVFKRLKDK